MNDSFDSDLPDYLLHQMDAARRAAFEQRLQREPELRAALQREADAFASFACAAAPAVPLGAAEQQAVLRALAVASEVPPASAAPRAAIRRVRFAWGWPAAAAILFLLNLVDFDRPLNPGVEQKRAEANGEKAAPRSSAETAAPANRTPGEKGGPEKTTAPRAAATVANGASPAALQAEIEKLRADKTELERMQERLRAEFTHEAQVAQERVAAEGNLNRLTTMELVDAASYAHGERRGLVAVGRGILTEPGVVVPTDPPPSPSGASLAGPRPPYAWSVFDEKERRGYLNLYQMPAVADDQTLQIWIRPADAKDFQRVGEVPPSLYGGSGAVQYALPASTVAPAEVLITIEPRNVPAATPTGPTVLRGP